MKFNFFWEFWQQPFKAVYKLLLAVLIISIVYYAFAYFTGYQYIISWEVDNVIDPVKVLFDTYQMGMFEFPISVDNYVISQTFSASDLNILAWPAYLLLAWLGVFISISLSTITKLSRFWFVVSAAIFTILLLGLKLDYLVLFGRYDKTGLIAAILLYYLPLYYFHFVKPNSSFVIRLLTFGLSTGILALLITFFSSVDLPFLHLASYGVFVPLIISIVFIFMVGHEIVSGLLKVISRGLLPGSQSSLVHFLIISLIFLLNMLLLLLRNTKVLDLNIYLIGSFLIFTVATVLGIWGYEKREITYASILPFNPTGGILYLLFAITAYISIAYFFMTGNDSFVEVVEDAIVFSQLSFCFMFMIYFLVNFFDIFRHNVNISLVVYKPTRMPYFTARLAALIMILALFFRFNMTPYRQAMAGYYSVVADLYAKIDENAAAKEYYNLSNIYSRTSHRANYALASIEHRSGKLQKEIEYLKQAVGKNPTEFSYVNLAARLAENDQLFEALFTLEEGLEDFPRSGNLMNNIGQMYLALENVDSAFYYLNNAAMQDQSRDMAQTNILAMLASKNLGIKQDTLISLVNGTTYLSSISNLLVLANSQRIQVSDLGEMDIRVPKDEKIEQLVYNYNKSINSPVLADSLYSKKVQYFYDSGNVSFFEDQIYFSMALANYKNGEFTNAFTILNKLAIQNPEEEYSSIVGKLALASKAPGLAVDYFKSSFQNGHIKIAPELAFAYMEVGELGKAAFIWRQIQGSGEPEDSLLASRMILAIEAVSIDDVLYSETETRFSFLKYRSREFDRQLLESLAVSFENEDIRAMAYLNIIDVYLELGQKEKAFQLLNRIGELNISQQKVLNLIDVAQCKFAYVSGDEEIRDRMVQNIVSDDRQVNSYLDLFETMKLQDGTEKEASFQKMSGKNPFFEPSIVESVKYLNGQDKPDAAYDLLLNAVNVNPFSIPLNREYALQCLRVGLTSYADDTRAELKTMLNSVAFETFNDEFEKTRQEYSLQSSEW